MGKGREGRQRGWFGENPGQEGSRLSPGPGHGQNPPAPGPALGGCFGFGASPWTGLWTSEFGFGASPRARLHPLGEGLGLEHPHGLGSIPWGPFWGRGIPMGWAPSLKSCSGFGASPQAGLHPLGTILGLGHPHGLGFIPRGCFGFGASPWPGLHPLGTGLGYSHGLGSIPWGLIWGCAPSLAVLSPPRNPSVPKSFWLKLGGNSSEKIGFTKIQQTPPSGGGTGDFNKTQDWLFCWV